MDDEKEEGYRWEADYEKTWFIIYLNISNNILYNSNYYIARYKLLIGDNLK